MGDRTVLIVGCGVFGLSTAVEMAKRGYKVTAIDAYTPPSPWSAACDYNKIIRAEYTNVMYTKLALEAINEWRSNPLFKGIYNECGRVMVTPQHHKGRREFERIGFENLHKFGAGKKVEVFDNGEQLASKFDFLKYNCITTKNIIHYNPESGLAHAANALVALQREASRLGVKFIFGKEGEAKEVHKFRGKSYIKTNAGTFLTANKILVTCGANTGRVVNLKDQQTATGLFVTFIRLTPQEYEKYKNMSILFDAELGYFFPPDPQTRLLKIALPGLGASNKVANPYGGKDTLSLPRYKNQHPVDTMPTWGIRKTKMVLGKYVPELAYHRLIDSKVCWIGDTLDSNFIIDSVPGSGNMYVATGDSGHGFKFLPIIGNYISDRLEGTLDPEFAKAWQWREGCGRFDPTKCAWRVNEGFPDLSEIDWVVEKRQTKL